MLDGDAPSVVEFWETYNHGIFKISRIVLIEHCMCRVVDLPQWMWFIG